MTNYIDLPIFKNDTDNVLVILEEVYIDDVLCTVFFSEQQILYSMPVGMFAKVYTRTHEFAQLLAEEVFTILLSEEIECQMLT